MTAFGFVGWSCLISFMISTADCLLTGLVLVAAVHSAVLTHSVPVHCICFEVSAYFTISKSGGAFKELARAGEEEGRLADPNQLLKRPHVVQTLACLRMIGYDTRQNALQNHLLQVRTGEGKSVIL